MAQQVKLKAHKRSLIGRNAIKRIKEKGLVPGVIYGSNQTPIPLEVEDRVLSKVLGHASSEHILVELEIVDGDQSTSKLALIQEVQHHPLKRGLVHVDFHAESTTEKITSSVQSRQSERLWVCVRLAGCLSILCVPLKCSAIRRTCLA